MKKTLIHSDLKENFDFHVKMSLTNLGASHCYDFGGIVVYYISNADGLIKYNNEADRDNDFSILSKAVKAGRKNPVFCVFTIVFEGWKTIRTMAATNLTYNDAKKECSKLHKETGTAYYFNAMK